MSAADDGRTGPLVVARLRAAVPDAVRGIDRVNGPYRQLADQLAAAEPDQRAALLSGFLAAHPDGDRMRAQIFAADPSEDPLADPVDRVSRPGQRPTTDLGNAERLADQFGDDVRYCSAFASWLVWTGKVWKVDQAGTALSKAKLVARGIYREAAEAESKDRRQELSAHARRSESASRLEAMLRLAESALPIEPHELDRDPWLLNVATGTVDLRTGELHPHRRGDLISKLIDIPYDPEARCPGWERFLAEVLPDESTRQFVHRAAGYSATGSARERVVLILHGAGRNGKGVLLQTLRSILGDYAVRVPSETFLARRQEGIPNDIAQLRGARFAFGSETGQGRSLAEAKLKDLTGGEDIPARFLHGEWFSFAPSFTPWIATNHKPIIRGSDRAIWDRLRLVPFAVRFRLPDEPGEPGDAAPIADLELAEKLQGEHPGILAWLVRGATAWYRDGLGLPDAVRDAVADYRLSMDSLADFLDSQCVVDPQAWAAPSALYAAYRSWCDAAGETPQAQRWLSDRLAERGFVSDRTRRGRRWLGIRPCGPDELDGDRDG